jgi:hypothetical protein
MRMKRLWKSLKLKDGQIVSDHDNSQWVVGEWRSVCAPTQECVGLNACENILDAINYVTPDILAEVEVLGDCIWGSDKCTSERMRIIRAWEWEKEDSVALSVFAARLCLKNFERAFPDDQRVRNTLELVEKYQTDPLSVMPSKLRTAEAAARSAAEAAARSAARSTARSAARSTAWAAAFAAEAAAWAAAAAAEAAAWAAAFAAEAAARSAARSTAWAAARSTAWASKQEIHDFLVTRFEQKPEYRP